MKKADFITVLQRARQRHESRVCAEEEQKNKRVYLVQDLYRGDFFGESCLLQRKPSPFTLVTTTMCEVFFLPEKEARNGAANWFAAFFLESHLCVSCSDLWRVPRIFGGARWLIPDRRGHPGEDQRTQQLASVSGAFQRVADAFAVCSYCRCVHMSDIAFCEQRETVDTTMTDWRQMGAIPQFEFPVIVRDGR